MYHGLIIIVIPIVPIPRSTHQTTVARQRAPVAKDTATQTASREEGTWERFFGGSRTMYIKKIPMSTTTANLKMLAYLSKLVTNGSK